MAKASSVDAELDAFETQAGVRRRRGLCRICTSPHRALYEAAFLRGWRDRDVLALAASKCDEISAGNMAHHFRVGKHHERKD